MCVGGLWALLHRALEQSLRFSGKTLPGTQDAEIVQGLEVVPVNSEDRAIQPGGLFELPLPVSGRGGLIGLLDRSGCADIGAAQVNTLGNTAIRATRERMRRSTDC